MAPLHIDGKPYRWRNVVAYVVGMVNGSYDIVRDVSDPSDLLCMLKTVTNDQLHILKTATKDGITHKFSQNPRLRTKLKELYRYKFTSTILPDSGKVIMDIRNALYMPVAKQTVTSSNLLAMLEAHGYKYYNKYDESKSIEQHMLIGKNATYSELRTLNVDNDVFVIIFDEPVSDITKVGDGTNVAFLDVRMGEYDDKYLERYVKVRHSGGKTNVVGSYQYVKSYYIVNQFHKAKYLKMVSRIAKYNDILIYQPSGLSTRPTQHFMTPPVKVVTGEAIDAIKGSIGAISSSDPLIKEMGLRGGDVIFVDDFSPHYRIVR